MNYVFGDDLQFFVDHHMPYIPNRDIIASQIENDSVAITTDEAFIAWYEHDALHYLAEQPFTKEGEACVAYLERKFNRGWLPWGKKYNPFTPKECNDSHITQELITETAEDIRSFVNQFRVRLSEKSIWRYGKS